MTRFAAGLACPRDFFRAAPISAGMSKFGPTRGEWLFRLVFSIVGLGMIGALIAIRGLPKGPGLVEVVGIAGLFFGGTAVMAIRALSKRSDDQG